MRVVVGIRWTILLSLCFAARVKLARGYQLARGATVVFGTHIDSYVYRVDLQSASPRRIR